MGWNHPVNLWVGSPQKFEVQSTKFKVLGTWNFVLGTPEGFRPLIARH